MEEEVFNPITLSLPYCSQNGHTHAARFLTCV